MGTRPPMVRPSRAIRSNVNVNEAGIEALAVIPINRQPLRHPGAEIVQQHVRSSNELMNDLLALGALQVELDSFLAGVVFEIKRRHPAGDADGLFTFRR